MPDFEWTLKRKAERIIAGSIQQKELESNSRARHTTLQSIAKSMKFASWLGFLNVSC